MERGFDIELRCLSQEFGNRSEGKQTKYSSLKKRPQSNRAIKRTSHSSSSMGYKSNVCLYGRLF